ncbi:DUF1501 domain-containing protein [Massilia sp. TS11]|uniref:DUF1501 domain-containing protein n=1 Tax=Massilia sp. TS11 TaxID=2908003 RepID=UPI001EDC2E40|nr:DUF1501 domain-containing protein [Massilia sp. TS11]MCG2585788.1 DUF1501 domain-containing protein [Massilia sp. TS11]
MSHRPNASRRAFLQRASALSLTGVAAPWALNLAAMAEAAAATATDYKALVCVFLYGGNDYANTLIPYDSTNYTAYANLRPVLAYTRAELAGTVLSPKTAPLDSGGFARQYALAPELAPLLPLFNSGELAVLLNVGTLVQPTTKAQYNAKSVKLPPKLFSHNDQQSLWQSSNPEGATSGWGGRIGDLFQAGNGNATFTAVNVSGNAVYLAGRNVNQYMVTTTGSVALGALSTPLFGSSAATSALQSLITQNRSNLFESEYNRVTKRAIDANASLTAALAKAPNFQTNWPIQSSLADQLKMVARMIGSADALGAKRQVFFVALNGFDTHDGLTTAHPNLLTLVSQAMAAFHASLKEIGAADKVTSFTASDFGRTLTSNKDGSDHGWGSMHFVLGGAVKGQNFYGIAPAVANNGPDDVGQGRLLPTMAVDQYAATLGRWMGASDSQLLDLLPNLANFNASNRVLGFL